MTSKSLSRLKLARRIRWSATIALFAVSMANGRVDTATAAPEPVLQTVAFVSDRLSVEVAGSGPDVILLPGYASSREVWRAEAERLAATHRVHLVQPAGFAGAPWVHGDTPFLEPLVEELARYVREAELERPAVIGHSMGGLTAVRLAQTVPEVVGRVMSVDSLPFFGALHGPQATVELLRPVADQTAQVLLSADEAAFRQAQTQVALGMARNEAARARMVEWSLASDRRALAAAIRDLMTTDARPGLAAMTTPVWAVYAADTDGGAPAAQADATWGREYADLPGVRLVRIDDARHFLMDDQPARFAEVVDDFLK